MAAVKPVPPDIPIEGVAPPTGEVTPPMDAAVMRVVGGASIFAYLCAVVIIKLPVLVPDACPVVFAVSVAAQYLHPDGTVYS